MFIHLFKLSLLDRYADIYKRLSYFYFHAVVAVIGFACYIKRTDAVDLTPLRLIVILFALEKLVYLLFLTLLIP